VQPERRHRIVGDGALVAQMGICAIKFGPEVDELAIVGLFVRSDAVDGTNLDIDQLKMDSIGRLGGHSYSRTRDQFDIKTQTVEEWDAGNSVAAPT
jgi:hypothetical protein